MVEKSIDKAKKVSAVVSSKLVAAITYGEKKEVLLFDLLRANVYVDILVNVNPIKDCCEGEINVLSSCLNEEDVKIIQERVQEMSLTYLN